MNEPIKIINNGIILVATELAGHLHSLDPEQGCTDLVTGMLRKAVDIQNTT
jgi:hypothetical protein